MSMLSKETFCKVITLIQEQDQINEKVSTALELVSGSRVLFGTSNKYLEALLSVLKEVLPDKYDYLSWWLYEAPSSDYRVELADGSITWDLRTPEALYEYIVNECP